ncbi:hypothetical protein D0A37_20050 [Microcoleus vaginatus HSN003]|nr:hypothetical protein D0A37_20050 [Microcoleus vaginatus HSN003]
MAQKPGFDFAQPAVFLANRQAATCLLVATRFRGVGAHGNPKTGLLRAVRATTRLLVTTRFLWSECLSDGLT